MGYKLKKSCKYPGCPNLTDGIYCGEHSKVKQQRDTRPPAQERGYDAGWKKIRDEVIKAQPICRICGNNRSDIVHHIPDYIPGTPHENYDLIGVCRSCHAKIHENKQSVSLVLPNLNKLKILYGPPGAGKSYWIKHNKTLDEIVIDYDMLFACLTCGDPHNNSSVLTDYVLKAREYLAQSAAQHNISTWMIIVSLSKKDKDNLRSKGAKIYLMDTPRITCQKNIMQDNTRQEKQAWMQLIDEWFKKYSRDEEDIIINNNTQGG